MTDEDKWDPYKKSHNTYAVNLTPTLNSEGNISDDESIDDWLIFPPYQRISAISVSKPNARLTPEYLSQIWYFGLENEKKPFGDYMQAI